MGQYYVPTLIDNNGDMETLFTHNYGNGLKLTEHSYIGNNFMAAVMNALNEKPRRVWWLGDYAEIRDFKNKMHRLVEKERKKAWSKKCNIRPLGDWDWDLDTYLINFDKKCFIQLEKYDNDRWQIHPLSLLTAVGNGRGAGDYYGELGQEDVGTWAGNKLMITNTKPENMIDATEDYNFSEEE